MPQHECQSKENMDLVLSIYAVENRTLVVRFGHKRHYQLSHLAGPQATVPKHYVSTQARRAHLQHEDA